MEFRFEPMGLASVCGGALEEKFQMALQKVAANINDPNTNALAKRTITLTVEFEPNKGRSNAAIIVQATTKLAPHSKVESVAFFQFNTQTGDFTVQEHNPKQGALDLEAAQKSHEQGDADKKTN